MNSGINEAFKAVIWTVCAVIFIDLVVFAVGFMRVGSYENQVVRMIQTAGGVTPAVMEKANKLSDTSYRGNFRLVPHGGGKPYVYQNKSYEGVYPTEWSTDTDNVPIYPNLTRHKEGTVSDVTEYGSLMTLLDHPQKLFAGKVNDFKDQDIIPSKIRADKVKEIKPIGYIDKNYFFNFKSTIDDNSIAVWTYKLARQKELTDQNSPEEYIYDQDHYEKGQAVKRSREYTGLLRVQINANDPKVHFNDKSLKGMQTVRLISGGNNIMGEAYTNLWSDVKANSYPHDYGAEIRYEIKIDIPLVMLTRNVSMFDKTHFHNSRQGVTTSLYRETKH